MIFQNLPRKLPFLTKLQKIPVADAQFAGPHCFYRGAPLKVYNNETKRAIQNLAKLIDVKAATEIWDRAIVTKWEKSPVWFHGVGHYGKLWVQLKGI